MPKCNADVSRLRGYKIKIYPTEEQKELIHRNIDSFRAIYNIALSIQNDNYNKGNKYIKYFDMCKIFSDLRNNNPEYSWMKDVQIGVIREAIRNVYVAFQMFFDKINKHPKFKTKKKSKKCFETRSDRTHVGESYVKIPEIGFVDAKKNPIPIDQKLYNTGIVFDGYEYWFYCQIEKPAIRPELTHEPIGIDVGIKNMITTSDGEFFHFSKMDKLEKRLKRQQRHLSKYYRRYLEESVHTKTKYEDIPKSKNMQKLLYEQHKTMNKIKNKRHNDINVATKHIVELNPKAIIIEGVKVSHTIQSTPHMNKYAKYMPFYEIHRQLIYKAEDRSIPVIRADESYPSTQTCSNCGHIQKVYNNRQFKCHNCGFVIDRDLNAAINLRNLAYI